MTLRAATAEDVPAVASLERALFRADAWTEQSVRSELTGPGRHALVAAEGDDVVGYVVTLRSDDVVDLERVAVRGDRQRRGVARRLLESALSHAAADGATRVLLEVSAANEAALELYARTGFEEIDRRRRYYRDGTDAVVMQRRLGAAAVGGRG